MFVYADPPGSWGTACWPPEFVHHDTLSMKRNPVCANEPEKVTLSLCQLPPSTYTAIFLFTITVQPLRAAQIVNFVLWRWYRVRRGEGGWNCRVHFVAIIVNLSSNYKLYKIRYTTFFDKILIVIIFTFYVFYTKRTHRIIIVKERTYSSNDDFSCICRLCIFKYKPYSPSRYTMTTCITFLSTQIPFKLYI